MSRINHMDVIILDSQLKLAPNGGRGDARLAAKPEREDCGQRRRRFPQGRKLSCPRYSGILASVAAAALAFRFVAAPAHAGDIVGLITKTNTNPYFVKMKQGFEAKAKELGLTPQAYAGKFDGDNDGQVAAIEQLMAAGAKGILLVPSDSTAIVPTRQEGARRRHRRHHPRHSARPGRRRRREFRH